MMRVRIVGPLLGGPGIPPLGKEIQNFGNLAVLSSLDGFHHMPELETSAVSNLTPTETLCPKRKDASIVVSVSITSVPARIVPPIIATATSSAVGSMIPRCASSTFVSASAATTFPQPIRPVGGVNFVSDTIVPEAPTVVR